MKLTPEQALSLGSKITELLEGCHWLLAYADEDGGINVLGHCGREPAKILCEEIQNAVDQA